MSTTMTDGVVHMDDLMNFQVDPDAAMVDLQLSMPYFNSLISKEAESMSIDPTQWQNPIDISQSIDIVQPQGYQPEDTNWNFNNNNNADSSRCGTRKSSVPSLSFASSRSSESPATEHTRAKITKKQDSKAARKKQNTSKPTDVSDDEDDYKRNKDLERNKVAASKCRQRKKVWVNHLEAQKSELEHKHSNLQHENKSLINEVTQLKDQLMAHASCGDPRIDSWIENEAQRFVQKTTDAEKRSTSIQQQRSPLSSSGMFSSPAHCPESSVQQPLSPTMSDGASPQPPIVKTEINYDHMPDMPDMFE